MSGIPELLNVWEGSQSPLILMGAGACKAALEIITFAEKWDIPILTTWNAIDLIEWKHPNFIGRPGIVATRAANFAIQRCDLLLSIGARLDPSTIAFDYEKFAPNALKVLMDIDQSEAMKIPNLDLFIRKDALDFIRELSLHDFASYSNWLTQCQIWKAKYGIEERGAIARLCEDLGESMTDEVLVISTSGTTGGTIFPAFFKQKKQKIILTSCGLGSMGGWPTAIGVALASEKKVVCIDGDGSFCQNIQELEVVRRLNLPITFFVVCNGGYASIRSSEMRAFGRTSMDGVTLPDIGKIAKAFGITVVSYRKESIGLDLSARSPLVVIVNASPDEFPIPRVMFDGKGRLDNMFPYGDYK